MFNLETAISGWRQQMLNAGIKTPVPLEGNSKAICATTWNARMKSGLNEQKAFEIAVGRIGQANSLKMEFKKVSNPDKAQQRKRARLYICRNSRSSYSLAVAWILSTL